MNLNTLRNNNLKNIKDAGPRYTPGVDSKAPNIEIKPLITSIEIFSLSNGYYQFVLNLELELIKNWQGSKETTKPFFSSVTPKHLINVLSKLKYFKPGHSKRVLMQTRNYSNIISSILREHREILQNEERDLEQHHKNLNVAKEPSTDSTKNESIATEITSEDLEKQIIAENSSNLNLVRRKLSDIGKLESIVYEITSFVNSHDFELIENNKMLLLGDWGTGKTHFLCDITKVRMERKLPTLLILANKLPTNINPIESVCKLTRIANTPKKLLAELNRLGKKKKSRALIIFDGINEGNRPTWKKFLPKITSIMNKYPFVSLILSCRSPFDSHIFTPRSRYKKYVQLYHNGFQEIELSAQKAYFEYYNIPNTHVPLLTPEFSRPLFLKILCETFSGRTASVKSRWITEIGNGQRGMTKLLEDFVTYVGQKIESEFNLKPKTCWEIIKGKKITPNQKFGIAITMANNSLDYIELNECLTIIRKITNKSIFQSKKILEQFVREGLLNEDITWENNTKKDIVRLPYQRFSDHIIARHLLDEYLKTSSEINIRKSFYKNKPLGKIFEIDNMNWNYKMPGLASAIMLEFPERVKRILPTNQRELVYYLPKEKRLISPLVDTFLEGILWRHKDSFSDQTDIIISNLLSQSNENIVRKVYESLVTIACRPNHPYSAPRLYNYLNEMDMQKRDLVWSEFLRNSYSESIIHRLINWIIESIQNLSITPDIAKNLILLLSLFLTSTDRTFRDKVTKCLVLLGEIQPQSLFELTLKSFSFNDPYVSERMLAASYGLLMRNWAFPKPSLKNCISDFAKKLYDSMFEANADHATSHILTRDYALGCLELSRCIHKNSLGNRRIKNLHKPFTSSKIIFPNPNEITEESCMDADKALHMDFHNYTIGRLVEGRNNYDNEHVEYRGIVKQIKWRMLNLGFSDNKFQEIDRRITERKFYKEQKQNVGFVDRYGKKYSWIAYFEIAGLRDQNNLLPNHIKPRISDCDIDPSFPEDIRCFQPKLNKYFKEKFISPRKWISKGVAPSYEHLLQLKNVDSIEGNWILLSAFIEEKSSRDPRKVFTFINGVFANKVDVPKLYNKFKSLKYPGNWALPQPAEDHYTFAGEIPWSKNYGYGYFQIKRSKRNISRYFKKQITYTVNKNSKALSDSEKYNLISKLKGFNLEDILNDPNTAQDKLNEFVKRLPKYIKIKKYKETPGILLECPIHRFGWESYHSSENQARGTEYIAPALCNFLNLKNKNNLWDLFTFDGKQASIYRTFGSEGEYLKSHLLYIRKDLLESYLENTNQKLIWFIWGEKDFKYEQMEQMRSEVSDLWSNYSHIHKKMRIARL